MTEETHNAAMAGSIGIIMAIGVSAVLGLFLMLRAFIRKTCNRLDGLDPDDPDVQTCHLK